MNRKFNFVEDYAKEAKQILPEHFWKFLATGAGPQTTATRNELIFKRYLVIPRSLRNVSDRNQRVSLLNGAFSLESPICVAPTAQHGMFNKQAEIATARGCARTNTLCVLSIWSTLSMELIRDNVPKGLRWQNIYVVGKEKTLSYIRRAEASGAKAIVVTCDMPELSHRPSDTKKLADCSSPGNDPALHHSCFPNFTWRDFEDIVKSTELPVVAKGILHPHDALRAVECGAKAVWLSNHGGRQLDGVPHQIEMLPQVRQVLGGRGDIYVDGGIRSGLDVLKCLALGSTAVFVGRPVLYGLAVDGEQGVTDVITILRNELDNAMALAGCATVKDVQRLEVVPEAANVSSKSHL